MASCHLPQAAFLLLLTFVLICRAQDSVTGSADKITKTSEEKCDVSNWDRRLQFTPEKPFYGSSESVTLSCPEEYELSQNIQQIQCQRKWDEYLKKYHNEWSKTGITCIKKCEIPQRLDSGLQFTPDQPFYGSSESVTLSCPKEYELSQNIQQIQCQRKWDEYLKKYHNEWSKTGITCIKKCEIPQRLDSGLQFTPDQPFYGSSESVTLSCPKEYELSQNIQQIWCQRKRDEYQKKYQNEWNNAGIYSVTCIGIQVTAQVLETSPTSIKLTLHCDPPNYCLSDSPINVQCKLVPRTGRRCPANVNRQVMKEKETITCSSLQPFSEYDITIYTQKSGSRVQLYNIPGVRTNETVPQKPEIQPWSEISQEIQWQKLSDCNGIILGYQIKIKAWRDYNLTFTELISNKVEASVTQYKVPGWKPGTNYTVEIQGFTSAGPGEAAQWLYEMEIARPNIRSDLTESNISHSGGMVNLSVPWVSDLNGPISEYQIIITRGGNRSEEDLCQLQDLPSFSDTLSNLAYITAAFPALNVTKQKWFTVGSGDNCHGYYNAPLSPGHNYMAFLRVISVWKQDRKVSCATYGSFVVAEPASSALGLTVALILLCLVLFVMVLFVYWKLQSSRSRRRKSAGRNNGRIPLKKRRILGKLKTEIPVAELLATMKRFRRAEIVEEEEVGGDKERVPEGRLKEYQMFDSEPRYPCEAGMAICNRNKNRYINIVPYDHSRVTLHSSSPEADYINASYIDGYKKPNFFIACQGPLPNTVDDFWQMVWQENSTIIVMLTDLVEQNKAKCEQYWPEQCQTYGDITVTLLNTKQSVGLITRVFSVQKRNSPFRKSVEQFHYLMWPDHGVPKKSAELVQLVEQMNECKAVGTGPVIVHCSAGIGRTGTFIALDFLLKMAKEEKKVDVVGCTQKLREKRVNMIQTVVQYCFLYDVLLEALLCGITDVPVEDMQLHVKEMRAQDPKTRSDGYLHEFEALEKYTELYQLQICKEAKKACNISKNRKQEILPADMSRPILMSILGRDGSPGYINAVFANSYAEEDKFIITQLPLKETLPEFWALVYDYKCTAVVLMNRMRELDESYPKFWPACGEAKHGPFHVKEMAQKPRAGFTRTTLSLTKSKTSTGSKLEVKLWELNNWPVSKGLPESPAALISILGEVDRGQQHAQGDHILVTCRDGASRSGLFCAGSIICEQIRTEGLVDVSSAVRTLKRKRYQLIPNVEQHRFCYQLALNYLDSFETYGNFK
uniref:Tyrosine-protein phosphatase non-receptor type 20 n=1 Tax=Geotrypetes seraphini TaxID=260995 RepID=A0A6P8QVV1_GEOSA|nr:receptor-type tyrosine-protein phosphatase alpha-like isoform X2 [Geotrypetes seraphini]